MAIPPAPSTSSMRYLPRSTVPTRFRAWFPMSANARPHVSRMLPEPGELAHQRTMNVRKDQTYSRAMQDERAEKANRGHADGDEMRCAKNAGDDHPRREAEGHPEHPAASPI